MTVGGTLIYTRITLPLLLLGVSLSIHGLSQARPSQHFSSPEVVIPSKVTSRGRGAKAPGWLSYRLRIGGQRHIVHMRVKRLLVSTHLPVFTYTEQHGLQEDHPFVLDDCYYHGYVEGASESLVALSSCSGGFQGMLQINDLIYEIKPIRHSSTFEHLVYQVGSDKTESPHMRCGLTEASITRQKELHASYNSTLKQSSNVGWWTHWRFVELGVVVDHVRFLYSQSNVSVVYNEVSHVINIVDEFYYLMQVDITLIGIEIWNKRNPISTSNDLGEVLWDFAVWKDSHLESRLHHDAAHLFIKEVHDQTVGMAFITGICDPPFNCAVSVFESQDLFLCALTVAHELGHNLGMNHDDQWCACEVEWCLMYAYRENTTKFSNCSYAQYYDTTRNPGMCIHSPPYTGYVSGLKFCGNRVVEEGEECDCGSVHQCERDPCCLLDCALRPGAACASGSCCKDCKFLPPGTLCRQQVSECDLPEWCNGTSHECPDDVYIQDGTPCMGGASCYAKTCNNPDVQCKEIFGREARSASEICYSEVNTQGNRFGHCGIVETTYVKCMAPDIMCGRIQCENVHKVPNLKEHSTVHQYHFNDTTCWGTDYHLGMSIPDIGEVKDGTVCAPGKICIGRKCASVNPVPQNCEPLHCSLRGVCNNRQHCHCRHGWAPPNCSYEGHGGSVDSGPPPTNRREGLSVVGNVGYTSALLAIPLITLLFYYFTVLSKKEKHTHTQVENKEEENEAKGTEENRVEENRVE
ncbi:disintegrin and metalloproteinase domain-containing protein 20 [Oryctolagus cuniculus]|uniref:disintegrin and metalloproteinase domain-containing protein 20 n=1 Tax=Oryctolagus cuniculus TaxID=9986 RepID=UPI00048C9DE9|nr:disintegrin and metalloproteinase domain-containing protein 20 [Oryctolagus cuniculus]